MSFKRFCAECGLQDVPLHDNFCQNCYWKFHSLYKPLLTKIDVPFCLNCNAIKLSSGWTNRNEKEIVPIEVGNGFQKNIQIGIETSIEIDEITEIKWEVPNPEFDIIYKLTNFEISEFEPHEEHVTITFKLVGGTCPICVKKKTGSGEITIQLRAHNRNLTQKEKDKATTIIFQIAEKYLEENSEAYLGLIKENYGGLDFFVGNSLIADDFINSLKNTWIGHHEKNFKLITEEKDNTRVYNITHLYRLPNAIINEFVEYNNDLWKVVNISKRGVILKNMKSHEIVTVKEWDQINLADPSPFQIKKVIISEDKNTKSYLLLNLSTYQNEEVNCEEFPSKLKIGEEVIFLQWKNRLYLP